MVFDQKLKILLVNTIQVINKVILQGFTGTVYCREAAVVLNVFISASIRQSLAAGRHRLQKEPEYADEINHRKSQKGLARRQVANYCRRRIRSRRNRACSPRQARGALSQAGDRNRVERGPPSRCSVASSRSGQGKGEDAEKCRARLPQGAKQSRKEAVSPVFASTRGSAQARTEEHGIACRSFQAGPRGGSSAQDDRFPPGLAEASGQYKQTGPAEGRLGLRFRVRLVRLQMELTARLVSRSHIPPDEPDPEPLPAPDPEPEPGSDPDVFPPLPQPEPLPM